MKKLVAITAMLSLLATPVLARDNHWRGNHGHRYSPPSYHHHGHRGRGIDTGTALAIGIGGLILGAAINESSNHRYNVPQRYIPPAPVYREPYCVTYETRDSYGYLLSSRTVCR